MAAQTIAAQVGELVGITAPASLDDWAAASANKLLSILPIQALIPFSTLESCNYGAGGSELTPKDKRILQVYRTDEDGTTRLCREVTPGEYATFYADTNSLLAPTAYDPIWARVGNIIRVRPAQGGMYVYARTLTLLTTVDTSATTITSLPENAEHLVVLDLAFRVAINAVSELATSIYTTWKTALGVATPTDIATITSRITTAIGTNEDVELAAVNIQELEAWIKEHQVLVNDAVQAYAADIQRLSSDRDKFLTLAQSLKAEYYEYLYVNFGIDLRPRKVNSDG